MKIFGICLWHRWVYREEYFDYSDICFWSSGTIYYRKCKCCGLEESRLNNQMKWRKD